MNKIEVSVASENQKKIAAVQLGTSCENVIGVQSESSVNPQPIGLAEIIQGAWNRIKSARKKGVKGILFAIENGLVEIAPNNFVDLAVVIVDDGIGHHSLAFTKEVVVPFEVVKRVLEIGPDKTTIGLVICDMYPEAGIDHQDIHLFLTNGKFSRQNFLEEGVKLAWEKLNLSLNVSML